MSTRIGFRRAALQLGGLVSAEGCFTSTRRLPPAADGTQRRRFVFQVSMATRDRPLLDALQTLLGTGSIRDARARAPHLLPMSTFTVGGHRGHRVATIPFAERHLLFGEKRRSFEAWRSDLDRYETVRPPKQGRSSCSMPGCRGLVRGRGLCRSHYYRATGY